MGLLHGFRSKSTFNREHHPLEFEISTSTISDSKLEWFGPTQVQIFGSTVLADHATQPHH